jgi:hypothetical protein
MYFLVALLIPAAFVYYVSSGRVHSVTFSRFSWLIGCGAGVVAVLLSRLVGSFFPLDMSSFFLKWLYFFLVDSLIPYIGCLAALYALQRGAVRERIRAITPLAFGIATIFLPLSQLRFYNLPDVWSAIVLPILSVTFLFFIDFRLERLAVQPSSLDEVDILWAVLPGVLFLFLVDLSKALWFFAFPAWTYWPLSILLVLGVLFVRLKRYAWR